MTQRSTKGHSRLTSERASRLEALPGWIWRYETPFLANVQAVRNFVTREGHLAAPEGQTERGVNITIFMKNCRIKYKAGDLTHDEIAELESVPGWSWSPVDARFDRSLAALHAYVNREHALPATNSEHKEDGILVGIFLKTMQNMYRRGILRADRIAVMEQVPGWRWRTMPARTTQPNK